jgi:hypothetical protein
MCLSGYCGDSGQCEFSTRQAVVIGVCYVVFPIPEYSKCPQDIASYTVTIKVY